MVLFALEVKCTLENIAFVYADSPKFSYTMKVKCTNCGEESRNWHSVDGTEELECRSGHGKVNFRYRCKLCARENTIGLIPDSVKKITAQTSEQFKPIATFDCRGLEPIAFTPGNGWRVEATESGQVFSPIDMEEENAWVDYDSLASQSVGIFDFVGRFIRIK